MYSDIEPIFFSTMPNSDLFLVKENPRDPTRSHVDEKKPTFEFQNRCHDSVPNCSDSSKPKDPSSKIGGNQVKREDSFQSQSGAQKEEEEEEGFRTPTSCDHRIPEAKQCPPAPRKSKPSSLKRKALHTHTTTRTPIDLSKEVESLLFPAAQHDPLSKFENSHQITKKVRRDGQPN